MFFTQQNTEKIFFFWGLCKPPDDFRGGKKMGLFNSEHKKNRTTNSPEVILQQPSEGIIVKLSIVANNSEDIELYKRALTDYAKGFLGSIIKEYHFDDNTLILTFKDAKDADGIRSVWMNYLI